MMSDEWVLLVPAGVKVETFPSPAVKVPTLVTQAQLQSMALAVASLLEQGLPADLGAMLRALHSAPASSPGRLERVEPAYKTPPEDVPQWSCACGESFAVSNGGELALKRHQATCGLFQQAVLIPKERQPDS
jgi:hypothetical protein